MAVTGNGWVSASLQSPTRSIKRKPQSPWASHTMFSIPWQISSWWGSVPPPGPTGPSHPNPGGAFARRTAEWCRFPKPGLSSSPWRVFIVTVLGCLILSKYLGADRPFVFYTKQERFQSRSFLSRLWRPLSSPDPLGVIGGESGAAGSRGVQRRANGILVTLLAVVPGN